MSDELDLSFDDFRVTSITQKVEKGKIVLPKFQRDFVWRTTGVGKLLESILNGYYINTLLTLPVTTGSEKQIPFPHRPVAGAVTPNDLPKQIQLVLDGQQRITSLYYALTAPRDISLKNTVYPQLFGLSFEKVVKGQLDENAVDWRRRTWDTSENLVQNDYQMQIEKDFIPFTIFKDAETFQHWKWGIEDFEDLPESKQPTREEIYAFDQNTFAFRQYDIPVVQLDADTNPDRVVQTFERINTQGLELGIFDILTARLWPDDVDLRELWKNSLDAYNELNKFQDQIGESSARKACLQTLALYRGKQCKEKNLRELSSENFEEDWLKAVEILDRAIRRAKSNAKGGLGVTKKFGFPYRAMMPTYANLLHLAENHESAPDHRALKALQQWYWSAAFSKRYSGSSGTSAHQDYQTVSEWIQSDEEEPPETIETTARKIPIEIDLGATTPGSGVYDAFMSLLMLQQPIDPWTHENIEVQDKVDDHHIFPKSRLQSGDLGRKYSETERNRILNRTLVQADVNRNEYQDKLPSEYLPLLIQRHPDGESGIRRVLHDHFINDEAYEAMRQDDYESFCRVRRDSLQAAVENVINLELDWSTQTSKEI